MNDDFEFVIYETPEIMVNGVRWYLAPYYGHELKLLSEWFTENIDFKIYEPWDDYDHNNDTRVVGYDILINSKVFMWLKLKYGNPSVDIFSDLSKWDKDHYAFDLNGISSIIGRI